MAETTAAVAAGLGASPQRSDATASYRSGAINTPALSPTSAKLAGPSTFKNHDSGDTNGVNGGSGGRSKPSKVKRSDTDSGEAQKRRCVSTACIACRKRKSKCDGSLPACAACASVYGTECIYDPNSDHRRKGVYKKDINTLKTRNSTLQTLIQAILNFPENEVHDLVAKIRSCESLDKVADAITARENGEKLLDDDEVDDVDGPALMPADPLSFEGQLSSKVGELRLDDGEHRFIGGTSNLLYHNPDDLDDYPVDYMEPSPGGTMSDPVTSWTAVTKDRDLIIHLLNMYFTWHYTFFTTMSKSLFYRDFHAGRPDVIRRNRTEYCSPILVNAMLALGCHFTAHAGARERPEDSTTAGDHFFREARRLLYEEDEAEKPRLTTVQALALMSVREAGCGREARGWTFSGMAFRMASDLGINFETGLASKESNYDENEEDVRRMTFWGCFLFDKCWSNYMGRLPTYQTSTNVTMPKFEVFPSEEAENWSPYTDSGFVQAHAQPTRTRAVALQILALCDISSDLVKHFYHPSQVDKPATKQTELKHLSDIHSRLETWKRELPAEMEPKEGCLSSVLTMHMMFQLLYIHLFRPFLKYSPQDSPLPAHVSPRKICTTAALTISKLLRLYKRSYGLRQICNIVVYIAHSACVIHLLNLPDKNAKRDITHGVKHLEEIAEGWPCARRTLKVLSLQARKWKIDLPEDAAVTLQRTDGKFGALGTSESNSPEPLSTSSPTAIVLQQHQQQQNYLNQHQQQQQQQQQALHNGIPSQMTGMTAPFSVSSKSMFPMGQNGLNVGVSPSGMASDTGFHQLPALSQYSHLASVNQSIMQPSNPTLQQPGMTIPHMSGTSTSTSSTVANSPAMQQQPQRSSSRPVNQRPSAGVRKPSATRLKSDHMFGGVEALLKEGQDWLVKDGSNLANGFENWQNVSAMSPPADVPPSWSSENGQRLRDGPFDAQALGRRPSYRSQFQPVNQFSLNQPRDLVSPAGKTVPTPQMSNSHVSPMSSSDHDFNDVNDLDISAYGMATQTYDESAWYQ